MNRLLVLIAVVFALASISGPATARALVPASPLSVSDQCLEPGAAAEAPAFKPCGKKVNGHAIPCQPVPGLLPAAQSGMATLERPRFAIVSDSLPTPPALAGWFRPPRA